MSSVLGGLAGIAEKSGEQALAFGLGFALGAALEPAGTALRQEAWKLDPLRAPDAGTLAMGVAQGQVSSDRAAEWAKEHGYGQEQFDALVNIANTGPALGLAFQAWRRGELTDAQFTVAMRRTGLEVEWDDAIRSLKSERLDLGQLATAIHRGIVASQGLLIAEPPRSGGHIPRVPQSEIDAVKEAAAHGIDPERLRVLVGNTGLPLALGEMLRLLNMGKVTEDDVRVAVAESNIRNEYMDAALELRRRLLTPTEYAEAELRGVLTRPQAAGGAAMVGMESADYGTLFELLGRPLPVHAITTGLARGGKYGGDYSTVPQPFQDAIRRSSTRPEYAHLAYANRYTYPSAFAIRQLASSGALSRQEVEDVLLEIGWKPEFAQLVAKAWTTGTAAKADPHIAKAQTQLWTATHKAYITDEADDALATSKLEAAGVHPDAVPDVIATWQAERDLIRLTLTATQVKKAFGSGTWTRDQAIVYLEKLGLSPADANALLDE